MSHHSFGGSGPGWQKGPVCPGAHRALCGWNTNEIYSDHRYQPNIASFSICPSACTCIHKLASSDLFRHGLCLRHANQCLHHLSHPIASTHAPLCTSANARIMAAVAPLPDPLAPSPSRSSLAIFPPVWREHHAHVVQRSVIHTHQSGSCLSTPMRCYTIPGIAVRGIHGDYKTSLVRYVEVYWKYFSVITECTVYSLYE